MAPDDPSKTLYLVDGTSQLFRAYFALPRLTNSDGLPTHAVLGFTNMLRKMIQDESPTHLAVAFDLPGKVFRHENFAEYKANRPPAPEELNVQAPYAKQVCAVLGIPTLELEGYEADDVIATCAAKARRSGFAVVVVASDKDLLQLVGNGITVLNPSKNERLDGAGVERSFGAPPERVLDVLGLMGDSVDNIPGVPGVGQKTALSAISSYGDLESVIQRAERFVAAYDGRDELLRAIDLISATAGDTAAGKASAAEIAERFGSKLARLAEAEPEGELRDRLGSVLRLLVAADWKALESERGPRAVKTLGPLKRELKGMDRGSSRKVWYAIHEHADQARLSRQLATLHSDAPVELQPESLRFGDPDRAKAHALFETLGFRALVDEFADRAGTPVRHGGTEGPARRARYRTALTREAIVEVVESCRRAGRIAVATQTDASDPLRGRLVGVALAWRTGEAVYVPVGHDYLGAPEQIRPETLREVAGPLLADPAVAKIGQDLKREAHVLRRHGMRLEGWSLDTRVAAFLIDSNRSNYRIDTLAREFLGRETAEIEKLTGTGAKRLSPAQVEVERFAPCVAEIADVTLRLAGRLETRLEESGLARIYRTLDGPVLPLLARMEAYGIRIDVDLLGRMSREMETALDRARKEIHELAGVEFNVDSPKQLREVLFDRLGLKPRRKTAKSGAASTDARTLEDLAGEHAIPGKILEYRELAKLKGTYVDSLPRLVHPDTGRVHTSFHPTGAATGRLSSSDPNLQNIPARTEAGRRIRAAFVPEDGWLFLAADYSQIELRVLAHLSGDPELTAAFRSGEDIHQHTAARVFEVGPDAVTPEMRRRAKAVNFGILYGMSESRLAREQGMARDEARRFIRTYFERFEKVREYIESVREQARRDGTVRTLFGRVRPFPELHRRTNRAIEEQALRAAVNTTIQGTAADLMKMAMLRVDAELTRAGSRTRMLLQVHDELLLEVPEDGAEALAGLVRGAMENVHPLHVPLVVDQKLGNSWLEVT